MTPETNEPNETPNAPASSDRRAMLVGTVLAAMVAGRFFDPSVPNPGHQVDAAVRIADAALERIGDEEPYALALGEPLDLAHAERLEGDLGAVRADLQESRDLVESLQAEIAALKAKRPPKPNKTDLEEFAKASGLMILTQAEHAALTAADPSADPSPSS